jgi:hypothetical protein
VRRPTFLKPELLAKGDIGIVQQAFSSLQALDCPQAFNFCRILYHLALTHTRTHAHSLSFLLRLPSRSSPPSVVQIFLDFCIYKWKFAEEKVSRIKNLKVFVFVCVQVKKTNSSRNGYCQCYMTMINILFQRPTPYKGK